MDRIGADFTRTVSMIKDRLGANPIPIQFPIGEESNFRGIVDLLTMQAFIWVDDDMGTTPQAVPMPEELADQVEAAHSEMVEKIAETDDELTLRYLEGEEISVDELREALRNATIQNLATPVLCGSALRNRGIQRVLDAVVYYLPSPLDIPPSPGTTRTPARKNSARPMQ
jgi:elongation factor G